MKIELEDLRDEILEICEKEKTGKECLVILSVGKDVASSIYMKNKLKIGEFLDIPTYHHECTEDNLEEMILKYNESQCVTGIILQLPLPKNMDSHYYINLIDERKDVDLLTDKNKSKIMLGQTNLLPATATSCIQVLEREIGDLSGKDILLIGRSDLVNNPLYFALKKRNATIQHCHSYTQELDKKCKDSHVIVTAAGCPNLISKDFISDKVEIVLDVSINRIEGKIRGDVTDEVYSLTNVTANPKGLGVCTVPNLFLNLIKMTKMHC